MRGLKMEEFWITRFHRDIRLKLLELKIDLINIYIKKMMVIILCIQKLRTNIYRISMIDQPEFLKEGLICTIIFHAEEEMPILVEQPQFLSAEVTYTEPGVKGDTATNTMKPATIDTGAEVKVPLFIILEIMIKVDIQKGMYVERIKS
jgi:hypothetical protein